MGVMLRRVGSFACAATILQAAAATAEPVEIVGGTLTVAGQAGSPDFTLVGDGFVVTGGGDFGNTGPAQCEPCVAGDTVPFDSRYTGSSLGSGPAFVNGVTYPRLFYAGVFQFDSEDVTFPAASGLVTITSPFDFIDRNGMLPFMEGFLDSAMMTIPVFNVQLTGSGTAIARFRENPMPGVFDFVDVTYLFSPSPIPEPASLSLVGAALAGLGARGWRRRRNAAPDM